MRNGAGIDRPCASGRDGLSLVVLVALTVAVGYVLTGPSPPRRIAWATGQGGGGYATFGRQYATRLGGIGLRTGVVP